MLRWQWCIVILGSLLLCGGGIFWYVSQFQAEPVKQSEKVETPWEEEENMVLEEGEEVADEAYPEPVAPEVLQAPVYLDITPGDCEEECEAFTSQSEKLAYCRSVCGLAQASSENCGAESGIQKDVCLKEKAVKAQDIEQCSEIKDEALRKTCQARVTEDFL